MNKMEFSGRFYAGGKEDLLQQIKAELSDFRYRHILGVGQTCFELEQKYGNDPTKI